MTTRWMAAMVECDARTQGAPIATLSERLRTQQRAEQRGHPARCFFALGALQRRVALIGVLVALAAPATAWAVSCPNESVKDKLTAADVAFVGRVVAVTPVVGNTGIAQFDYRFVVDRAVKGALATRVTVRSAKLVDIDAQEVTAASNVAIGVLATTANGRLVTSSCSLVDPGSLMGASDEPKGGLIKVAIGLVILGIVLAYSLRRLRRRPGSGLRV